MKQDELYELIVNISNQVLEELKKSNTPPYPAYYNQIFIEAMKTHNLGSLEETMRRYIYRIDNDNDDDDENAVNVAREGLDAFNETTSNVKKVAKTQKDILDLASLDIEKEHFEKSREVLGNTIKNLHVTHENLFTEIKRAEERILELEGELESVELDMNLDRATKLYNRKVFEKQLTSIMNNAKGRNLDLFIMMIRIDEYKEIVEEYGLIVAEKVLLFMSKTIQNSVRAEQKLYKFDTDTFVLLLNRVDVEDARMVGERIQKRIDSSKLMYANRVIHVTVSIGAKGHIAEFETATFEEAALSLLNDAIHKGRNSMSFLE